MFALASMAKSCVSKRAFSTSSKLFASRVLVLAEHNNNTLGAPTLNAIGAASKLNPSDGIDLLVIGSKCSQVAKSAQQISGVKKVMVRDAPIYEHQTPEPLAKFLQGVQLKTKYSHIVATSTTFSKNVLPRLAALLDVQPVSDVLSIKSDDTFVRPIYAGNALATVQSGDSVKIFTVRGPAFPAASSSSSSSASLEEISEDYGAEKVTSSKYVKSEISASERPELTAAKIVISGGRGMGNGDNFKILYELADAFGNKAAVGASRAAVDAGFVPNELQVGQTGKIVAPEFYLAVGISGAIQHLAGMKDSKIIAAINKDEEAPIFQVADYGLVGDLFEHVPKLTAAVKAAKK